MKEDLAEWLNTLYDLDLSADAFADGLDGGCALCRHANNVNRAAQDFQQRRPEAARHLRVPGRDVVFQSRNVTSGSFVARDNVSNFIAWCRQELWIRDALMFETNDLVERCNEKNFVLCLLEVARRGAKFGMLAPMLIQLEEEIEEEIRDQETRERPPREPEEEEEEEEEQEQAPGVGGQQQHPGVGGDQQHPGVEGGQQHPGVQQQSPPPARRYGGRKEVAKSSSLEDDAEDAQFAWQQKRVLLDMRNLDELVSREPFVTSRHPTPAPLEKKSLDIRGKKVYIGCTY